MASKGTTEQYFMLNILKNGGKGCFNWMTKVLSFFDSNFSTNSSTHFPGEDTSGSSKRLKLYSKSFATTDLVESLPNKICL